MGFQTAAKKAQAKARRPLAYYTGDGVAGLTLDQKVSNLVAVENRLKVVLAATTGARLPVDKMERALNVEKLLDVQAHLLELRAEQKQARIRAHEARREKAQAKKQLIKLENIAASNRAHSMEHHIIDVCREFVNDKVKWLELIEKAKARKAAAD